MFLVRLDNNEIAVEREDGLFALPDRSLADLLSRPLAEIQTLMAEATQPTANGRRLAPIDGRMEIWASGVTYQRSRTARMNESVDPDIYDRVYTAARPELFFKAPAWRVVTHGEPVAVRDDSTWNVPEPELAVLANRFGEIVGFGACNDMSSRSLEGENPLYLPQAKIYAGACALGPTIRPAWEVDVSTISIHLKIERHGQTIVDDSTSTTSLVRTVPDLIEALFHADNFPDGVWLSTGTGIVPSSDFSLQPGDKVTVAIPGVATTINIVDSGRDKWLFLAERQDSGFVRTVRD